MKRYSRQLLVLSVITVLIGCSGSTSDGNSTQISEISSGINSDIYGIWNTSYSFAGDGREDISYLKLSDAEYVYYDYQADSFGTGENCYLIEGGTLLDLPIKNEYMIRNLRHEAYIDDGDLVLTFSDFYDIDRDNDNTEIHTFAHSRLEGISEMDFNEC